MRITTLKLAVLSVLLVIGSFSFAASDLKVEDIVAGNLDSIAKADARAAAKSRWVVGDASFKVLTGGAGTLDGKAIIASENRKMTMSLKFPTTNYRGERFTSDGNKVSVATSTDAQLRSSLGDFIHLQDILLREGLWGGTLGTGWALLDVSDRKPKLSYEGQKNIDGRNLYDVRYKPKKSTDIEIHLFFDTETFRHVLTVYTLTVQARLEQGGGLNSMAIPELGNKATANGGIQGNVGSDAAQANQAQTRYRVEERFSDYKTADGYTLPNHYQIHYTQEPQGGKTTVLDWDVTATQISQNIGLDDKNFEKNFEVK